MPRSMLLGILILLSYAFHSFLVPCVVHSSVERVFLTLKITIYLNHIPKGFCSLGCLLGCIGAQIDNFLKVNNRVLLT